MEPFSEILDDLVACAPRGLARFEASIDPEWIDEALTFAGKASIRRRKLPADSVMWLVVGMALFRDRSIANVVDHLDPVAPGVETLAPSAIPAARARLGWEPMEWLFRRVVTAWADEPQLARYRGLDLFGIDGSHLRVQDSDENFEEFGKPGGRAGSNDAGYPQVRLAVLMKLRSRLLMDAAFGPFRTPELQLAEQLLDSIPANSLTVLDRGYFGFATMARLLELEDRHVLVRLRSNLRFEPVELLADGTALVDVRPSREARKKHPGLPACIRGRIIAYQHEGGQPSRLFTTLTDPAEYPADELVELHHERWELEVGYDELKTHMLERHECLRSLTPANVRQELWGSPAHLQPGATRDAPRGETAGSAADQGELPHCDPHHPRFLADLRLGAPGRVPRFLKDLRMTLGGLIIPQRRSERRYPRHVKIKMSNYKRNRGQRSGADPPN